MRFWLDDVNLIALSLLLLIVELLFLLLLLGVQRRLLRLLSELFNHSLHSVMEFVGHVEGGKLIDIEAALCLSEVHLIVELALHDLIDGALVEPFDALAFLPETKLGGLAGHDVGAKTVLLTSTPVA